MIIHRKDCPQIAIHSEPERYVEIDWGVSGERYLVDIEIRAEDRPGLIRDISELCVQMGVNVRSAKGESHYKEGHARLRLSLELSNVDHVVQIISRISRYPNVIDVRRIGR
jgi:GTP pyrophosphokinase